MPIEVSTLKQLYPLDTMLDAHVALLTEAAEVRDLSRGDRVFDEGANDGEALFLLSGRLNGVYSDGREREIEGGSQRTRYAVGDFQPRRFTATVASPRARILVFERDFLEKVLTWDQISRAPQFTLPDSTAESARWVFQMLRSKALLRLPAGNIERMFERFEPVDVMPGNAVITAGEEGDFFYVIKRGKFHVVKQGQVVATLGTGDSFGEDALISDEKRNATVIAKTAGGLMRLSKADFGELLRHPIVDWVTPGQAAAMVSLGGHLVDVRMAQEHRRRALQGSVNMPLYRLREELVGHDDEAPYVVYCETGERSASAAFILNKLGYSVYALRGGLASVRRLLAMSGYPSNGRPPQ